MSFFEKTLFLGCQNVCQKRKSLSGNLLRKGFFIFENRTRVRNHFSAFYRAKQQQQQHMLQQNWLVWLAKCVIDLVEICGKSKRVFYQMQQPVEESVDLTRN